MAKYKYSEHVMTSTVYGQLSVTPELITQVKNRRT